MKIGAAWLKDGEKGKYLSCQITIPLLGTLNFAMFRADKKNDNSPDYEIVWSEPKKQKKPAESNFDDSDIPF